ncbi:MAG: cytochrome-c peroxidase, partial [Thiomicrorhabdus sp.]|nr:cytochrome-c peroxidase [Thiomicrorhabdus sp.]
MKTNILGKSLGLCVTALLTVVFSNAYATSSGGYGSPSLPAPAELTPQQALGKFIFFDENLSEPAGQSCASCHMPNVGFADPDAHLPVSEGVIPDRFGHRNAQTVAYASFSPPFSYDTTTAIAVG